MSRTRLLTAVLVAGSAAFAMLPLAHASAAEQQVVPSVEAWYQPNPSCEAPTGCLGTGALPAQPPAAPVPVPLSPYPAGTMHVAVDGGKETARSYLQLSLPLLDATLSAASLDVPLDTAQADGKVSPEAAKVQVCTFQGSIQKAEGSIEQPPTASCSESVTLTYDKARSTLHADLAPLVPELSNGAGLVLLPDADAVQQTDTWHVVFSAHDRADQAKTAPASLRVTLTPTPQPSFEEAPAAPAVPLADTAPPPALGTVSVPPVGSAPPPAVGQVAPQVPQQQPVPLARAIRVGYAYPAVWLLPLAFLLMVPLVARALTQDLTPAS
jgi:hypothetical protein